VYFLSSNAPHKEEDISRLATIVVGCVCFLWVPVSEAASNCTSVQAQCAVEIGGQCDPNTGRWFYGRYIGKVAGGTKVAFHDCVSRKLSQRK
jgi:hypothetical protein